MQGECLVSENWRAGSGSEQVLTFAGMIMKRLMLFFILIAILAGCVMIVWGVNASDKRLSFTRITQDEAKEMMEEDNGHVILDVRREDEYAAGHIPGTGRRSFRIWIRSFSFTAEAGTGARGRPGCCMRWDTRRCMSSEGSSTGLEKS